MGSSPSAIGVLASLSLASSVHVPTFSQAVAPAVRPQPQAAILRELRSGLLDSPPVLGAPFSAIATTVWPLPGGPGPGFRATARYFRDWSGRVRVEQSVLVEDAGTPQTGDPRIAVERHPRRFGQPVRRERVPAGSGWAEMRS
jgi:hypothetical protein